MAGAIALLGTTACNDLLDIEQHGVLNYDTYYQTDEEAETAATAMYVNIRSMEYYKLLCINLLSDDFWAGGGGRNDNAELEQLNEFTYNTDMSYVEGMFTTYYTIIYKANVILGHVPEETDVQKRVHAEARAIRAWAYFDLITLWGNPPLVDHELAPSEYTRENGSTEKLWELFNTDLQTAIDSGYLPEKSSVNDQSTWRVTKQFAQAMYGKGLLWQKNYKEASKQLQAVIDSHLYELYQGPYEDINAYTTKMNCESMFESVRIDDRNNVFDNFDMVHLMTHWRTDKMTISSEFSSLGWGFCTPQKALYDAFVAEEGEDGYRLNGTMKTFEQMQALGNTINAGSSIISEGYFMWKNRVFAEQTPAEGYNYTSLHNPKWMRYAEVLLLAAEAYLEDGENAKAADCLNQIRTRAKLAPKSNITLKDIQIEKRLELCGEMCRYQDMVRWGIAEELLKEQGKYTPFLDSNGQVTYQAFNTDSSKYGFKSRHNLLPYPGTEVRLNSAIVQNTGW